jgi:hypothetical protein
MRFNSRLRSSTWRSIGIQLLDFPLLLRAHSYHCGTPVVTSEQRSRPWASPVRRPATCKIFFISVVIKNSPPQSWSTGIRRYETKQVEHFASVVLCRPAIKVNAQPRYNSHIKPTSPCWVAYVRVQYVSISWRNRTWLMNSSSIFGESTRACPDSASSLVEFGFLFDLRPAVSSRSDWPIRG